VSLAGRPAAERLVLAGVRVHGRGDAVRDVVLADGRVERFTAPGRVRDAERVDCDGATLLPGLWDHHVHMEQWALARRRLDLSGTGSAAEAAAVVRAALADPPAGLGAGELLVGYGFRDGLWPDVPRAGLIDADRPVVLISGDLHCAWMNRAAMSVLGVEGCPTGVLREDEAFAVNRVVSRVDTATMDRWVLDAARAAAARGVVGVVDLEMDGAVPAWERRAAAGSPPVRVRAGVYPDRIEVEVARGLRTGLPLDAAGRVEVGPLKIVADGSLNTRTAWCHDPYPGTDGFGRPSLAPEELEKLLVRGSEAGFVPAIHAIGDRALTVALDAVEAVGCRGSIEHAQLVTAADVTRMARLGMVASIQPEHAMDDRDVAERHWAGREHRAFVVGSLARAGVRLALGSDAPVAPLDPWVSMAAAVDRHRDGREAWQAQEAISVDAALAASTSTGGVVAVGDAADLVVVPHDPTRRAGAALRSTPVLLTLCGGEVTADLR